VPNILDPVSGIPFDYDIIVSGECGVGFDGFSSGTGEAEVTVAIDTWDYGTAGLPTPGYSDEFIGGNRTRAYITGIAREGGGREWHSFSFRFNRSEMFGPDTTPGANNRWHLQWGAHIEGAHDIIRSAGPFDQNGILTANVGALEAEFRNMVCKVDLNGTPVINLRPEPCPPNEVNDEPDGGGVFTGGNAELVSGLTYRTEAPYVSMSIVVFINGIVQRWGVDYVETDPDEGTFTFTNPVPAGADINVQYTTRDL